MGVSIQVEKGEFLGVIGHTGSGKSTLIQMLNGLLRPTSGQVLLDGKDIWAEPKKDPGRCAFRWAWCSSTRSTSSLRRRCSRTSCSAPKTWASPTRRPKTRAREAAHFTGLKEELLEKSPFELSGGEKRRAAIAGVIAMDPEVLILDEPTAGLDPRGRDVLLAQITQYHKARGNTVLLVSHSMEDIGRTADRILVMNHGHAAMLDETKKVFARGPELEEMGLRVPQITKIMQELVAMGLPVDASTLTVDDALHQLIPILKRKEELR